MLFLAIDHSGGPTNNNITCWPVVVPPGEAQPTVMFARSTDERSNFSAPVKVNDDPVNPSKWHWFGTFFVAPNGRLDAVCMTSAMLPIIQTRNCSILQHRRWRDVVT